MPRGVGIFLFESVGQDLGKLEIGLMVGMIHIVPLEINDSLDSVLEKRVGVCSRPLKEVLAEILPEEIFDLRVDRPLLDRSIDNRNNFRDIKWFRDIIKHAVPDCFYRCRKRTKSRYYNY